MTTRIQDYDYPLPGELVAQYPLERRDASRLLVLSRKDGRMVHARFRDLAQWLDPQDLLVVNDTRVFPARLRGVKERGGKVELLLHHLPEVEEDTGGGGQGAAPGLPQAYPPGAALARATYRGRLKVGQTMSFGSQLQAEVIALPQPGQAELRFFSQNGEVRQAVLAQGEVPLPPYIRRAPEDLDRGRYQTVFASRPGAIACPTAGLHFTETVFRDLNHQGVQVANITLHVGLGTFMPVRHPDYTRHRLEAEYFEIGPDTARVLNEARAQGRRLVAVGTTTVRVLEYCARPQGFAPQQGWCDLYIYPGYRFRVVDRLLTNFHLPKSTLFLLVSAFAGREFIMAAYQEAIKARYRFYSYGDCMLII